MTHHDSDTELDPRLAAALGAMNQQQASHPDWPGFQQKVIDSLSPSQPSLVARLTDRFERWLSQPAARFGLATSALLAIVAGLMFLTAQPGVSYASVVMQLREMNTMILTSTVEVAPNMRTETVIHYQRPDLIRSETTTWFDDQQMTSTLTLTDLNQQRSVVLIEGSKMAMVITLPAKSGDLADENPLFWLDELQQLPEHSAVDLGTQAIDGYDARGYQVQTELLDIVIWADQHTAIPVRFEISALPDSPLPADFSIIGDAWINVELDPALFSQDIPSDYQVMPIDASD